MPRAIVNINCGDYAMAVSPQTGGSILSFQFKGEDIFRPALDQNTQDPLATGCFPCIPYFGRLSAQVDTPTGPWSPSPTHPPASADSAIHGEGWICEWSVDSVGDTSVDLILPYQLKRKGGYPFPFTARQKLELTDNGALLRLSVSNTHAAPIPVGLGFHPFFIRTHTTEIKFSARKFWSAGVVSATGFCAFPDGIGAGAQTPLPQTLRDDSYAELSSSIEISEGRGRRLRLTTTTPHLHLYAPVDTQGPVDYFCLEPISHLPGQFLGADGRPHPLLAPNETRSISMALSVIA